MLLPFGDVDVHDAPPAFYKHLLKIEIIKPCADDKYDEAYRRGNLNVLGLAG